MDKGMLSLITAQLVAGSYGNRGLEMPVDSALAKAEEIVSKIEKKYGDKKAGTKPPAPVPTDDDGHPLM